MSLRILTFWPWLLMVACSLAERPVRDNKVVARINGQPIYASQIKKQLQVGESESKITMLDRESAGELKRKLLEQLIDEELLLQQAERQVLVVDSKTVEDSVEGLLAAYPPSKAEEEMLKRGLDRQSLRQQLKRNLTIAKLLSQEVFERVVVQRDEIEKYFQQHQGEFVKPERVRVRQILVRTQEEAAHLRKRLQRGESFETLARDSSIAPEAAVGGDLGYFVRGQMPKEIEESAFSLHQPGQLSQVVASPFGYHLFQLVDRQPAREMSAAEAFEAIEKKLLEEKKKEALALYLRRLREGARIEINFDVLGTIN
jgi:peptidyl-prolyl cis-trans isomerase C